MRYVMLLDFEVIKIDQLNSGIIKVLAYNVMNCQKWQKAGGGRGSQTR